MQNSYVYPILMLAKFDAISPVYCTSKELIMIMIIKTKFLTPGISLNHNAFTILLSHYG